MPRFILWQAVVEYTLTSIYLSAKVFLLHFIYLTDFTHKTYDQLENRLNQRISNDALI